MLTLRSIVFYLGYGLSLILFSTFCILAAWILPLKKRYTLIMVWNRFAIRWLAFTCGVHHHIKGKETLPPPPFVMVSNHQSPWETIFLYYQFKPLCAVLKIELLSIPFFGWCLRLLQPIAIDRSKRKQARSALMTQGLKQLQQDISVLVFPEGTRVDPGHEKKFSSGAAELAIKAKVPIIPVAHNAGLFWPAHKLHKRPGTITVTILEPVDTVGREPKELTQQLQQDIKEALSASQP